MKKYLSLTLLFALIVVFSCCTDSNNRTLSKQSVGISQALPVTYNDSGVVYPRVGASSQNTMYADKKITFQVEELKRADSILEETAISTIFENVIKDGLGIKEPFSIEKKEQKVNIDYNIKAHYNGQEKLVNFGVHSFFRGMYTAYADHRPFVLSPDIIWLLISQGFANHVNNNAEELRSLLVDFEDKATLVVHYNLGDKDITWENMFSSFPTQIAHFTGKELIDNLTTDFTTTTPVSKIVSDITVMTAFSPYFEYWGSMVVCGIPEITLEGTPEDWEKVLKKAQYLKKYKLGWWINELEPILKQFIKTSKGNIDKEFWKNMCKIHTAEMCGESNAVDGWIAKFFPYLSDGQRTDLKRIALQDELAPEVVTVNLNYRFSNGVEDKIIPLEIWAGFVGLQQDRTTLALKPEIGWLVRKRAPDNIAVKYYMERDKSTKSYAFSVSEIPKELLQLEEVESLLVNFTHKIIIPDEMGKIKINRLYLSGEITEKEIERICKMFPNTELVINEKEYNLAK